MFAIWALPAACHEEEPAVFKVGAFLHVPKHRMQALQKRAEEVSNPKSGSYGQYFTSQEELAYAIGVSREDVGEVTWWLDGAGLEPEEVAHADVVAGTTGSWGHTYDFGLDVQEGRTKVPPSVELIVTPAMPSKFCHSLTKRGKDTCEARKPCAWKKEKKDSDVHHCKGKSAGLICWPIHHRDEAWWEAKKEAQGWKCFDELAHDHDEAQAAMWETDPHLKAVRRQSREQQWKDRRRGRLRAEGVAGMLAADLASEDAKKHAKFLVRPCSRGISLLHNATKDSWLDMDFSFEQNRRKYHYILHHDDFKVEEDNWSRFQVLGLENLRPVSGARLCINSTTPSNGLRRHCMDLVGAVAEFALPFPPESVFEQRQDLDIPPARLVRPDEAWTLPTQAVAEFADETFSQKDVRMLLDYYGFGGDGRIMGVDGIRPKKKQKDEVFADAGEGSLDIESMAALGEGAPTMWIGIDNNNIDGFMMAYLVHIHNESEPPLVHSVSWGDGELYVPPPFLDRLDYELMKAALRGLTILIASGDNGINTGPSECEYNPDQVWSSAWATGVGATMRSWMSKPYCQSGGFENMGLCDEHGPVAATTTSGAVISTSGGFSTYRPRPRYQDRAVEAYLAQVDLKDERLQHKMPCVFDEVKPCVLADKMRSMRAGPDIVGPGHAYLVVVAGVLQLVDGTSASTPAVGAMITLLNAEQRKRGMPPLGFLNHWLYQTYEEARHTFIDVTVGDIAATEKEVCKGYYGFPATPGWDPSSGLGVPRFSALVEHLPRSRSPSSEAAAAMAPTTAAGVTWATVVGCIAAVSALLLLTFVTTRQRGLPVLKQRWQSWAQWPPTRREPLLGESHL